MARFSFDERWHVDCKSTLSQSGRVSAQTRWVARCRKLSPLSSTHMWSPRKVADWRSKVEAVDVERWRPGREAFDEVRSCAAVSRGDSHRRSMGRCWKDHVLPDPGRPPALSRERRVDDGRSGRSPSFRVGHPAGRRPSVVAARARSPAAGGAGTWSDEKLKERLADLESANFRHACVTADTIDDRPGHFASLNVARLRRLLRDRYRIACDADDVVRTLKGSSVAESPA